MTLRASLKHGWIAIALSCGACAGGGGAAESPVSKTQPPTPKPQAVAAQRVPGVAAQPMPATPAVAAGPTIPAGAKWTIFCGSITSDDHVARATAIKESLMKNARARDWYVIHQDGRSSIYLGYYKEIDAKAAGKDAAARADAQRAKSDKEIVDALPNPMSPERKLFNGAQFAQLDAPDPEALPEYSLTNAPGYFSVQIGVFTGSDRKKNAVAAVREARDSGIKAYYYHGESTSSVCIGSWPAEALKRQNANAAAGKRDDNSTIVVNMTDAALTKDQLSAMGANGGAIEQFQAKADILDPTLKQTLEQYPEHAVDGAVQMMRGLDKKTGQQVSVPRRSFIVEIPHATLRTVGGDAEASVPTSPRGPVGAPGPDLGARLRGIGQ